MRPPGVRSAPPVVAPTPRSLPRQRRCFVLAHSAGDLCAQEALGTAVAAAIEAKGSKALYVKADLAVVDDVKNIIAKVDETFGKLHGLVNSAAVATRGDWVGAEAAPVRCTPLAPRHPMAALPGQSSRRAAACYGTRWS